MNVRIRDYKGGEKLPSSIGYIRLPDIAYECRDCPEDEDGFNLEIQFFGVWIKVCNIDFE